MPFDCEIVVGLNLIRVRCSIDVEELDIIRLERDFNIVGARKKCVVEVLEEIFLQVRVLDCTEVVESLDIAELLAGARTEVVTDSNDRDVNIFLTDLMNEILFSRQ